MLWVRSKAVEAYLGETLVGCVGLDGLDARWVRVPDAHAGLAQLREWSEGAGHPVRARIWLGSSLSRPLMLGADCGARTAQEAAELALAIAGDSTGLSGDLKVWTSPWRDGCPTLAVATRKDVLATLQSAKRKGWHVSSVRPWWNQVIDPVLNRSRAQARTIGWSLAEPDGLVRGRVDAGQVMEAGYETSKARDPDWTLLRRRLAIGWGKVDEVEHFGFEPTPPAGGRSVLFGIGHAALTTVTEAIK